MKVIKIEEDNREDDQEDFYEEEAYSEYYPDSN